MQAEMTPSPPAHTIVFLTLMNHQSNREHVAWLTMGCRPCWSTSAMGPPAGEREQPCQGVSRCPQASHSAGLPPAGDWELAKASSGARKALGTVCALHRDGPNLWVTVPWRLRIFSVEPSSSFCFAVLGVKPRALSMLGKSSAAELDPFYFATGSP